MMKYVATAERYATEEIVYAVCVLRKKLTLKGVKLCNSDCKFSLLTSIK